MICRMINVYIEIYTIYNHELGSCTFTFKPALRSSLFYSSLCTRPPLMWVYYSVLVVNQAGFYFPPKHGLIAGNHDGYSSDCLYDGSVNPRPLRYMLLLNFPSIHLHSTFIIAFRPVIIQAARSLDHGLIEACDRAPIPMAGPSLCRNSL